MRYPPVARKAVVVTGASSGIGRATARLLRDRGWLVAPTARKPADLDALRAEGFAPVPLDLASPDSVVAAAAAVPDVLHGPPAAIVDNAGYGQPGAIQDLSRDALRAQFETNVFGTVDFTNRLLPGLRAQGPGRVVVLSSVVGRLVMPILGAYAASKFALEAIGDAWRLELRASRVSVSLVEPGPIATSFRRRCVSEAASGLEKTDTPFRDLYLKELSQPDRTYTRPTDVFRRGPEAVAAKIHHALTSSWPRARYPVTGAAWLGVLAARLLPTRLLDAVIASSVIGRPLPKKP